MTFHRAGYCCVERLPTRLLLAFTYTLDDGILSVYGTEGRDVITLSTRPEYDRIDLQAGQLRGSSEWKGFPRADVRSARIWTGGGSDTIDCGGFDLPVTVFAGDGEDTVFGSSAADEIHGGLGTDTLRGFAGNDTIFGGDGGDLINLGSGDDEAYGRGSYDRISGGRDSDLIYGEDGYDSIYGGPWAVQEDDLGADSLFGGSGKDYLRAGYGSSLLDGGEGDDHLTSLGISDTLDGGAGSDYLMGGNNNAADVLRGGDGTDAAWHPEPEDIISSNVEDIAFADSALRIRIVDGELKVYGAAVADDFTLTSDTESIALQFGEFRYTRPAAETTGASFWLDDGDDLLDAGSFDLPLVVFTGEGNDSIVGSSANDEIHGGRGMDTLHGMDGDDRLFSGLDNDSLFGGAGNDTVVSVAGADLLDGGDGEDAFEADGDEVLVSVETGIMIVT